jgi:hypothetical protein
MIQSVISFLVPITSTPKVRGLTGLLGLDTGKAPVGIVQSRLRAQGSKLLRRKLWFSTTVAFLMESGPIGSCMSTIQLSASLTRYALFRSNFLEFISLSFDKKLVDISSFDQIIQPAFCSLVIIIIIIIH